MKKLRENLNLGGLFRLLFAAGLAVLAACDNRNAPSIPAAKNFQPGGAPVPGRAVIPPLTDQSATNHAAFRARICDNLTRVPFEARAFPKDTNSGPTLRYRLFKPLKFDPARRYPLVLSLHGRGAEGSFEDLLKCDSPFFAFGPARFVAPEEQARHPAFVVVPWSGGANWKGDNTRLLLGLLDALGREFPIDRRRIYITGQSMGGSGVWQMITQHPEVFAAAVPVCGGGDPASAARARGVAVWAFHGSADSLMPVSTTRGMIGALFQAGDRPIYWEYAGGTHSNTAERAYGEPLLLDWLFEQRKP